MGIHVFYIIRNPFLRNEVALKFKTLASAFKTRKKLVFI